VNTAIATRDEHLRNPDFLNAPKFPRITFTSSKVWREGGKLMVAGTLDLHGVKQELVLPFEEAYGRNGAGNESWSYTATVPLNRKAFGIGADSVAAKLSLKDEVDLNLLLVGFFHEKAAEAPAPKAKPAPKKKAA
jgi:polyisoprenoid-binding protein YceI